MTTVIGYLRVSTAGQAESGAGLDAQRAAIATEADRRGWDVVWCVDEGASGSSLNRPALTEALRALKRREATTLVVAKLDRLSRSVIDFADLLKRAERQRFSIVCLDLGVDTTTATGRLVANVVAAVAEFEREAIAARTRDALHARRGTVSRMASVEVWDRIMTMAGEGMSGAAIARTLDADRVPTPSGCEAWHASTVRRMIASARKAGRLSAEA